MKALESHIPEAIRPKLDVLWVWKAVVVVLAFFSLIAVFVSIWQCVDISTNNAELYSTVCLFADDIRLLHGYYTLLSFALAIVLLSVIRLVSLPKEDGAAALGSWDPLQGTLTVLYVVVLVGYFASVVLGGVYKDRTLPLVKPGLLRLLANETYMQREPNARWIFTETGARLNHLQSMFSCCGINDVADYNLTGFPRRHEGAMFPFACCQLEQGTDWKDPDPFTVLDWVQCKKFVSPHFHEQGCMGPLNAWLQNKTDFLLGFCVFLMTLAAIQVMLTAFFVYGFRQKI